MIESDAKKYIELQERVRKSSIGAFNYAFCRLLLNKLLELKINDVFDSPENESSDKKNGCRLGFGTKPQLKPLAEILIRQLLVQMKLEIDFDSQEKFEGFVKATQTFLSIFEKVPIISIVE